MEKRVTITVYGFVHGVSFRYHTKERAVVLGLRGWVRNEPDGSVRTVAEGPEEKLQELVEWCRKGPSGAEVKEVEVEWGKGTGGFEKFEIKY